MYCCVCKMYCCDYTRIDCPYCGTYYADSDSCEQYQDEYGRACEQTADCWGTIYQ